MKTKLNKVYGYVVNACCSNSVFRTKDGAIKAAKRAYNKEIREFYNGSLPNGVGSFDDELRKNNSDFVWIDTYTVRG